MARRLAQFFILKRSLGTDSAKVVSFKHKDLVIEKCRPDQLRPKPPDWNHLKFGHTFSDHMLEIEWSAEKGWAQPRISPFHDLRLHPGAKCLHYATELFEGMKAFRGIDNKIRVLRPDLNMIRMKRSAQRACLPTFDGNELLKCIDDLIRLDQEWVPRSPTSSLYIRPTFIGTDSTVGIGQAGQALLFVIAAPVGSFFPTGMKPVGLLANPAYVRSWPGGVGNVKMGSNYGPTIQIGKMAADSGCQQVLWLFGPEEQLTEVGTMNIFVFWRNEKGERELVTPPLEDGLILPGVTRQCLLDMTREWNEFKVSERNVTMKQLVKALEEKRLLEIFGAGTACIVCPVNKILYQKGDSYRREFHIPTMEQKPSLMQRLFDNLSDIQYARKERREWMRVVV